MKIGEVIMYNGEKMQVELASKKEESSLLSFSLLNIENQPIAEIDITEQWMTMQGIGCKIIDFRFNESQYRGHLDGAKFYNIVEDYLRQAGTYCCIWGYYANGDPKLACYYRDVLKFEIRSGYMFYKKL